MLADRQLDKNSPTQAGLGTGLSVTFGSGSCLSCRGHPSAVVHAERHNLAMKREMVDAYKRKHSAKQKVMHTRECIVLCLC